MKKSELIAVVEVTKTNIKNALQTVYDALNPGQQKQIIKNDDVKTLFDLYGVDYAE